MTEDKAAFPKKKFSPEKKFAISSSYISVMFYRIIILLVMGILGFFSDCLSQQLDEEAKKILEKAFLTKKLTEIVCLQKNDGDTVAYLYSTSEIQEHISNYWKFRGSISSTEEKMFLFIQSGTCKIFIFIEPYHTFGYLDDRSTHYIDHDTPVMIIKKCKVGGRKAWLIIRITTLSKFPKNSFDYVTFKYVLSKKGTDWVIESVKEKKSSFLSLL